MSLAERIEEAREEPDWEVLPPPATTPPLPEGAAADELRVFYGLCGGIVTSEELRVGFPERLIRAQEPIANTVDESDRSYHWWVFAEEDDASSGLRLVVELAPSWPARCLDGFWDVFGVAGSQPVVAMSVEDLLERLIAAGGEPYWEDEELDLGDAYDHAGDADT